MEESSPRLRFSSSWDLLGPFQVGTREASWGADPLEYLGGFRALQYDSHAAYPSSLGSAGQVHWTRRQANVVHDCSYAVDVALTVGFPNVDWRRLQSVYGWAALQYQAWARGELMIEGDDLQTVLLYTDNVLEYWIDEKPYFGGDLYAYRRAPLVLFLKPGAYRVDIRLVRDVRVMGAVGEPSMSIKLKAERSNGGLVAMQNRLLVSDVVARKLASPYASLPLRNEGLKKVEVRGIEAVSENCTADMFEGRAPFWLAPGQSRSLTFRLKVLDISDPLILLRVTYKIIDMPKDLCTLVISHTLSVNNLHAPHKITFLHPSQIVSYAILRAPSRRAISTVTPGEPLPILLNLHGAGLDADSDQVRHMLDTVPDLRAWVIFPTGVTLWSGDDWHAWGFADVRSAIASIPGWIEQVGWEGPVVDLDKWFVSGHSNGGQGTLYALTHQPDKIIGAAPVSGYMSIQAYVAYQLWNEADCRVTYTIQSCLQSFRHELLVENFKGIPIVHQHGSEDSNVPTFHSRRLYQLTSQTDQSQSHSYVELAGKDHWYDGIMTTPPLKDFYALCLAGEAGRPELPRKFQIVVANPADMGSRGGLVVDQLRTPDQVGKMDVIWDGALKSVYLETSNIRRFHFKPTSLLIKRSSKVVVDGQTIQISQELKLMLGMKEIVSWLLSEDGSWKVSNNSLWQSQERCRSQLGPLQSILRTQGHFHVRYLATEAFEVALQISRNLYQYFGADSELVEGLSDTTLPSGNIITVALGTDELPEALHSHPIMMDGESGIQIRERCGTIKRYALQRGLGIIFLRPLALERLELIVWGFDGDGLRQAARLLPMLTGVGQPDFVVVRRQMAWEGAAGALAMGTFDSLWQLSKASFMQ